MQLLRREIHVDTAGTSPGSCDWALRKQKVPSFPLRQTVKVGGRAFKGAETCIHYRGSGHMLLLGPLTLSLGTPELCMAHRYIGASTPMLHEPRAFGVRMVALCGFKKELVHPAAEKLVDSAVFLPHSPFCSDLTPPQCHYSCTRSGTPHTKVSFSHIHRNS